jgi:hypothetical protein
MSTRVIPWPDPPEMNAGAPLPVIHRVSDSLLVAYVCRNPQFPGWDSGVDPDHPGFDIWSAVLRFDGVAWHHFGAPNDEVLSTHPLHSIGLGFYGFWEVLDSPRVSKDRPLRHWVVTFHDETLEVVAASAVVVSRRDEGEDTHTIALKYA